MSTRSENIRFNVYLNDKQAGNTMGNLYKQSRILKSELRKLKIGSQEWINKMKELKKVEHQLTRVRSEMRNTNSTLSRMAGTFNKYFTMITAGIAGVVAAIYGLQQSTQVFTEFEKTLANVMTLLSDAEKLKYRDFLKKGSIQIVRDYGFAVSDTNKALFDAISAGVEAGKSVEFMNDASKLAIGGVTDLHTSVDGLTTVINAFKLKTEDAKEVSDAFFSAQKEGKTTVAELSAGIGKAAPLAHSLGISYQELLSATAALTKGGIDTESAFTYLRGVFSSMIKPSKELTKLFKTEFGHALNASEVKALGFTRVMDEMNILMQKYPNRLQSSVENVRALTAVTALSGKGLQEYKEILEKVNNDIGEHSSLSKAFAEQEKTLSQNLEEAKGNIIAMTISLVEGFRPAIIGVTKLVSRFSHLMLKFGLWLKDHTQQVKFYAKALAVVLTSLATYKTVLAATNAKINIAIKLTGLMQNIALRSAIAYNKLTGNIGRAAAAQRVLNTTIKANPLGLILSAISMAVTAYTLFRKTVKKTTDEQVKLNKAIKEGQEIMTNSQPIEDRYKVMHKLSQKQLKNLKDDIKAELELISDKEAKILTIYTGANNEHVKKIQQLRRKLLKVNDSYQRDLIKNDIYWEEKRLDEQIKKEQGISATELDAKKRNYEKMVKAINDELKKIKPVASSSGVDDSSPINIEINKLEELNRKIKELSHEAELDRMTANERQIQQVKDKYAKLIAEAKGYDEQTKRLEELRDAEIKRKQAEFEKETLEARKSALLKIETEIGKSQFNVLNNEKIMLEAKLRIAKKGSDEYIAIQKNLADIQTRIRNTAENNEIEAVEQKFKLLKKLAKDNGITELEFTDQLNAEIQAIHQKYNAQEIADNKQKNWAKLMDDFATAQKTLSVTSQMLSNISGLFDEHSEEHKALAVFQATIDAAQATLAAFKSGAEIHIAVGIAAAAAAAAFGAAQIISIVNTDYSKPNSNYNASISSPNYAKGGIAYGSRHSEGGISLIDSKTGVKVGEMEDGEPYMILSRNTYKNNKKIIDALLDSSQNHNGEKISYIQPGYYPQPDLAATMGYLVSPKYANGAITNVSNVYNQQKISNNGTDNNEIISVLYAILTELQKDTKKPILVDLDGALQFKESLKQLEQLENSALV